MEPIFTLPDLPRYTRTPFPPYRYLPFRSDIPHPRNDPAGHSYHQDEEFLPPFRAQAWRDCEPYLYGVDLFNHGYWWEAHEAWEAVWLAAGRETLVGQFLQGLIQLAGAQLKRFTGGERGAQSLTESGIAKLALVRLDAGAIGANGDYLGIAVAPLIDEVQRCLSEDRGEFPRIALGLAKNEEETA